MYALVGCSSCSALWIIDGEPERTQCPRCGRRHQVDSLRRFVETEDKAHARDVRSAILAQRQDESEAFAALPDNDTMAAQVDDAGVDDREYLESAGIDPDAVAAAGDRTTDGAGGSTSRIETVRTAVKELDSPTTAAIVDYATGAGCAESKVRSDLEKLLRRGELTRDGDEYRLL